MTALDIAIFLHVLLLVYWLGGDLGTFYSSRYIVKPDLSVEARSTALKIMSFCDVFPRICLVLFLPSGLTLIGLHPLGQETFGGWKLLPIWILGLAWLALVVYEYRSHGAGAHVKLLQNIDLTIRIVLVTGLLAAGIAALTVPDRFGVESNPRWLGAKVALYAIAILCGVMIRVRLKPFGAAWVKLVTVGSSPETEAAITRAIHRSEPFVYVIWFCVLGAAFLGIAKPGAIGY